MKKNKDKEKETKEEKEYPNFEELIEEGVVINNVQS